jgi:hypothetical protein
VTFKAQCVKRHDGVRRSDSDLSTAWQRLSGNGTIV